MGNTGLHNIFIPKRGYQGAPLDFIPKSITDKAMGVYLCALLLCSAMYANYAMLWYWWLFGLIEVCGFFYYANVLSKSWRFRSPKLFVKKLFWTSLSLRLVWVILSYILWYHWTGTAFTFHAGDELLYDGAAQYAAGMIWEGNWNIISSIRDFDSELASSDIGYPVYLSILYAISDKSVLFARVVKAIWSAWTVVLVYKLAMRNFGESVGRMAAILCMLMPNLIFYCGLQLKEIEMVFLATLFVERADYVIRRGKVKLLPMLYLMLIPGVLFFVRTALAAVLVLAFFVTLILSTDRIMGWGRRIVLIVIATVFAGTIMLNNTSIGNEVKEMWQTRGSTQESNMEWRSIRSGGNSFAKYAGAVVFAPMIFTIPFPTMTETPNHENQRMIHGGNFVKNITSYFTILALFILLFSGDWRKHVLPLAVLCGYLVVLVFSNFAQSERFHLPTLPFALMFAVYGLSKIKQKRWMERGYVFWCILMMVAAIAWNWFKLAGRGMV